MTDEMPLDLRSLGDVDSPELVRAALSGFRRRFVRTLVWVVLVVVAISSTIVAFSIKKDLRDQIEDARGVVPGTVYKRERMTAILAKVADLGDRTGFHVIVSQPDTGSQHSTGLDIYQLNAPDGSLVDPYGSGHEARVYDSWFALRVPADGRVELTIDLQCAPLPEQMSNGVGTCHIGPPFPRLEPIVIDLNELGVPTSIWHGGSR